MDQGTTKSDTAQNEKEDHRQSRIFVRILLILGATIFVAFLIGYAVLLFSDPDSFRFKLESLFFVFFICLGAIVLIPAVIFGLVLSNRTAKQVAIIIISLNASVFIVSVIAKFSGRGYFLDLSFNIWPRAFFCGVVVSALMWAYWRACGLIWAAKRRKFAGSAGEEHLTRRGEKTRPSDCLAGVIAGLLVLIPIVTYQVADQHLGPRESGHPPMCESQLSMIHKGLAFYEAVHGEFPDKLSKLYQEGYSSFSCFICPSIGRDDRRAVVSDKKSLQKSIEELEESDDLNKTKKIDDLKEKILKSIDAHGSYIYLKPNENTRSGDIIVADRSRSNHGNGIYMVVFNGPTRWIGEKPKESHVGIFLAGVGAGLLMGLLVGLLIRRRKRSEPSV